MAYLNGSKSLSSCMSYKLFYIWDPLWGYLAYSSQTQQIFIEYPIFFGVAQITQNNYCAKIQRKTIK